MKKIIIFTKTILLLGLIFISPVVNAESLENNNKYLNDGVFIVDGRAAKGSNVTISVLKMDEEKELDWDDFSQWKNIGEFDIQYYDSCITDEKEKYSFKFKLSKNGIYHIRIGGVNDKIILYKIFFTNEQDNKAALALLDAAVNNEDISQISQMISEKIYDFCVYTDEYKYANTREAAKLIYQKIKKEKAEHNIDIAKNSNLTMELITKACVSSLINLNKNIDLSKYDYSFFLKEGSMLAKCYNRKCSDKALEKFKEKISDVDYFDEAIRDSIIEITVKVSGSVNESIDLLKEEANDIGIKDTSVLDAELIRKIKGENSISTVDDIVKYINSYKSNSNGTNSNTGSGSGASSRVPKPVKKLNVEIEADLTNNDDENKEIFKDINEYEWARGSIEKLYKLGIVNGTGDGMFEPGNNITREEFVKMIIGIAKMNLVFDDAKQFRDVNENDWYYKYVMCAYEAGIIKGIGENEFGAGLAITREDIAVIIYNTLTACGKNSVRTDELFVDDARISEYAQNAVYNLKNLKIINGYEDNSFAPQNFATRAEAAKAICALSDFLK